MMQKVQGMSADKDNLLDLHAPENHYHGVPKDEDGNDTDNRQTDSVRFIQLPIFYHYYAYHTMMF
jgi:hypothetical protein